MHVTKVASSDVISHIDHGCSEEQDASSAGDGNPTLAYTPGVLTGDLHVTNCGPSCEPLSISMRTMRDLCENHGEHLRGDWPFTYKYQISGSWWANGT
eukprot:g82887.t1